MSDLFWWLESVDTLLNWETRQRIAYAMEITGASRRQERLAQQQEVLQVIGSEHERYVKNTGLGSYEGDDVTPHVHGQKPIPAGGDKPCLYPGCSVQRHEKCSECDGHGTRFDGVSPTPQHCDNCHGSGSTPVLTAKTPSHTHDSPPAPYQDQAETIHSLKDGWSVKKHKTFGDLKYEGQMMTNCIQEDADGGSECDYCNGTGECSTCEGGGKTSCDDCGGEGENECRNCDGVGHFDCENCDSVATKIPCTGCSSTGKRSDGSKCNWCEGTGARTHYLDGKVNCSTCDGSGKDDEGEECYNCDGTGHEDCPDCGGEGHHDCDECDGRGNISCDTCGGDGDRDCYECDGSGQCTRCDGEGRNDGNGNGGPAHYYKPFTQDEADEFERAPGGPRSLRDPDNIPHVSWLTEDHDDKEIHDVLGRENHIPKPTYQHKILDYMGSQLPDNEEQLPGMGDKCSDCKGEGHSTRTALGTCKDCNGSGKSDDTDENQVDSIGTEKCRRCGGIGRAYESRDLSCSTCKGTGEPTVGVKWGYHGKTQRYTKPEINSVLSGDVPKPDAMLIAKHKTNTNKVETLADANHAEVFAGGMDTMDTKQTCPTCNGNKAEDDFDTPCRNCNAKGFVIKRDIVRKEDTHDLYAMPTSAIGKDQMEYSPAEESWTVKDGKGAKLPLEEKGAKIPWEAMKTGSDPYRQPQSEIDETNRNRDQLRHALPEIAQQFVPRIAKSSGPSIYHGFKAVYRG